MIAVLGAALLLCAGVAHARPAGTALHKDTATGAAYAGKFEVDVIKGSALTLAGKTTASCNDASFDGTSTADGATASIVDTLIEDTSDTVEESCPTSPAGRTIVWDLGLPWAGASIVYAKAGGADGVLNASGVQLRTTTSGTGSTLSCYYGGAGDKGRIVFALYNRDNATRPVTATDDLQAQLKNAVLTLDAARPSDTGCAPTLSLNGNFAVHGEATADVFTQKLYITG
ncbi:hypothetical protein D5S17_08085 [Pseudonocardiaceae bacterium YIM PH 21723]|nr:hypothetical protein D5S17_08085 [Pseudonocardiaceae bacterium YIM PH 21723]